METLRELARRALIGDTDDDLTYLSEGAQRIVYRWGDFVFKVEHECGIDDQANSVEYFSICKLYEDNPYPNTYIPAVDIFEFDGDTVLVMEFVRGQFDETYNLPYRRMGLIDSIGSNIILMEDGRCALIDLGCPTAEIWEEYLS